MTIFDDMQAAIGKVSADAGGQQRVRGDGQVRGGAWTADIIGLLNLSAWSARDRIKARRISLAPECNWGSLTSTGTGSPPSLRPLATDQPDSTHDQERTALGYSTVNLVQESMSTHFELSGFGRPS